MSDPVSDHPDGPVDLAAPRPPDEEVFLAVLQADAVDDSADGSADGRTKVSALGR